MFSTALAQTPAGSPGASDLIIQLVPFAIVLVIMYVLMIRPQQRRLKAHQEMVKNIRRGDTIVMNSGMIGKVTRVIDDNEIEVEIAEGVKVRLVRQMVTEVRAKGEPAAA